METVGNRRIFVTKSTYNGSWLNSKNCMDGFGRYVFSNSTEYRGFFKDGLFHGFGRLRLPAPFRVTFKGEFEKGSLKYIEDMWFHDGLHVKCSFENNMIKFDDWKYCSKRDRRFAMEFSDPLLPVPDINLSCRTKLRPLHKQQYDTEEGVYNVSTGFVAQRLPPFAPIQFVRCPDEIEWIKDNCRTVVEKKIEEPKASKCLTIIDMNLKAEEEITAAMGECQCGIPHRRKRMYFNLCAKPPKMDREYIKRHEKDKYKPWDHKPMSSSSEASCIDSVCFEYSDPKEELFMVNEFDFFNLRDPEEVVEILGQEGKNLMDNRYSRVNFSTLELR